MQLHSNTVTSRVLQILKEMDNYKMGQKTKLTFTLYPLYFKYNGFDAIILIAVFFCKPVLETSIVWSRMNRVKMLITLDSGLTTMAVPLTLNDTKVNSQKVKPIFIWKKKLFPPTTHKPLCKQHSNGNALQTYCSKAPSAALPVL